MTMQETSSPVIRVNIHINGAVQGVGFRPFIYRLAQSLKLNGWVINSSQGVVIEAEGAPEAVNEFIIRIEPEKPPHARIYSFEHRFLDPVHYSVFSIRESDEEGAKTVMVLPDIATCPDCLSEIFDSGNRRYLYPFTNCTNCGPRFTIIEKLPYDRKYTSMKHFTMCPDCRQEYDNPLNRRFHAQPNACPVCGPHLELWDNHGTVIRLKHDALMETVALIKAGKTVAVKGIGGFHLMVNALDDNAVKRLRQMKRREEKPFALMYPNLATVQNDCVISTQEQRLLLSAESPIVILEKKKPPMQPLSEAVAPDNPYLGVMLPYSPLHHLLMRALNIPVVATSGNRTDEPICTDEREALKRLEGIADFFLVHNRPIVRHADDSIGRIMAGREMVIRRARGYAPLPVLLSAGHNAAVPGIIGVGAHLKNTVALNRGRSVFISQHIGDLESIEALDAFHRVLEDFKTIYGLQTDAVACDLHPDYASSKYAGTSGAPVVSIQHHFAHIVSCMTENEISGPVLGVAWDGTGFGTDHTVWGGEFLLVEKGTFERFAHLRPFMLPGGDMAVKEPRRSALGVLYEIFKEEIFRFPDLKLLENFRDGELQLIQSMMHQKMNCPVTTSAGRLFDAVAALAGLKPIARHEGQAAMALEFAAGKKITEPSYPFHIHDNLKTARFTVDWEPMIRSILEDIRNELSAEIISMRFHRALAEIIIQMARRSGLEKIALSGGCFQNKLLLEYTVELLKANRFKPYWHQRVPPNDGGISLGQVAAALQR